MALTIRMCYNEHPKKAHAKNSPLLAASRGGGGRTGGCASK